MSAQAAPVGIDHLRLSKLLGTKIRGRQNEDLGKLDNVVIDDASRQGRLSGSCRCEAASWV